MIVIVLLLSELCGCMSSFSLLTDTIEGRHVSLLPCLLASLGTCSGDFHPTIVIEGKTFFMFILPTLETVPSPGKAHMNGWTEEQVPCSISFFKGTLTLTFPTFFTNFRTF